MNWELIVQCVNITLGILLIIRLFKVKLIRAYHLFCTYLMADLLGSVLWILSQAFSKTFPYRWYWMTWLIIRPVVWIFTLLVIYNLLAKILAQLPGLLRLSKRVLHGAVVSALIVGLISARFEYSAPGVVALKGGRFLVQCWITELVFDRVIATTALLSLLAILAFLLWFPVTIPKNLAVFSVGFTVYFTSITVLLLVRSFWPDRALPITYKVLETVSVLLGSTSSLCFAYWTYFLSPLGEVTPTALAIQRPPQEKERLVTQLELINDALLKAAARR